MFSTVLHDLAIGDNRTSRRTQKILLREDINPWIFECWSYEASLVSFVSSFFSPSPAQNDLMLLPSSPAIFPMRPQDE